MSQSATISSLSQSGSTSSTSSGSGSASTSGNSSVSVTAPSEQGSTRIAVASGSTSGTSPPPTVNNEGVETKSETDKSTGSTTPTDPNYCSKYSALLDGTFFRVVSVADDGSVKAACVACPDGKKPLSGKLNATTNFLLHLKVSCTYSY
jgi:hypothetical protein